MILVTGATGNVGSAVVAELTAKGTPFRAFVRDEQRARARLGSDVELAVGDFDDPGSIARALDGVEAVFLSSADQPNKVAHETAVIDAARAAGVRRIVKTSTVGAEAVSPLPPFDWHGRIEAHLEASGIPSVVLHSYFYMTNLLSSAEPVRQMGKLFAPLGGAKIAMIDPRDTGAVAAVALTDDEYDGKILDLSGPETITYEQVAEELSATTGGSVEFVNIPDAAARETFVQMGFPDWLLAHFDHLFPLLRSGVVAQPTDTVRAVTGREPRSFAQWASDHADAFRA
jgi:uncharacterized protein YbjT (DUF2867 family)